jgi:hypothetical protein
MSRPNVLRDLRLFSASPLAIARVLRRTTTLEECRASIRRHLAEREDAFARTLEHGIYAHPTSPYRRLLEHAGIELGDAVAAVRSDGADAAASAFRDAGVYVTAHEFAGRQPIVRPGLELQVSSGDFDNPQMKRGFELQTGGSGGLPRPILVDFRLPAHDGMHLALFRESAGNRGWPSAMWLPVPPGVAGLRSVVSEAAVGETFDRWFSQTPVLPPGGSVRAAALAASATAVAAARRTRIPFPRHVPPEDADEAARWLSRALARTKTGYFFSFPSSAVRVCAAARERGYDISGAHFRVGSEPLTPAKQAEIHAAGARVFASYYTAETALVGMGCARPEAIDDVHLALDKLVVLQREKQLESGESVGMLVLSNLLPTSPKILLNVEIGDYGTIVERDCGCALGELGLTRHLHGIRSYEKLTSEGMNVLAETLIALVEEVLPSRFGGSSTDYQVVEVEEARVTRVKIVVAPRVGALDENDVVETTLSFVRDHSRPEAMMADFWREAGTVGVVRREPFRTPVGKVFPRYALREGDTL